MPRAMTAGTLHDGQDSSTTLRYTLYCCSSHYCKAWGMLHIFHQHGIHSMPWEQQNQPPNRALVPLQRSPRLVGFRTISTGRVEYEDSSLTAARTKKRGDVCLTTAASNPDKLRYRQDMMMLAALPSPRYRADMKPEPYRHGCARTAVRTLIRLNHMAKQAFSLSTSLPTNTSCLAALKTLSHEQPLSR